MPPALRLGQNTALEGRAIRRPEPPNSQSLPVALTTSTKMQVDLLAHITTLDNAYFQANAPGALIERVQGDTTAVQRIWLTVIQAAGRDLVALISLLVVALNIDWKWTLAALVGVPLLVFPMLALQRYVRRKTAQTRNVSYERSKRLDEIFHGISAVKLNGMERYQVGRFEKLVNRIVREQVRSTAGKATMPGLIDIMTGVGFFAVLLLGAGEIVDGTKTVGDFMSFFSAMVLTFQPLRKLGALAGSFQVAAISLERVYDTFDLRPRVSGQARDPATGAPAPRIALDGLTLSYGDTPVLQGAGFIAEAGEITALVGASGAGKSTIFNVLTRLAEPDAGTITIDGTPVTDMPLGELRSLFSVVTQDALLFDETIRENITLGRTVDEGDLRRAVDAAHVSDFADGLPLGLDTLAGPRGSALSGGQRQRVAIARAILRDTPILLLDEATSALDAQSERLIQTALERASRGRTTLVIAHRLATIRDANKIVVMDMGRVVEQGTHQTLLEAGGRYAELYRLQFEGEE